MPPRDWIGSTKWSAPIACATVALALLSGLISATAQASSFTVAGAPAPGPDAFDKVSVNRFGPKGAGNILVLCPGTGGGAGGFSHDARALVSRIRDLQVWAVDRREQALEDTSRFQQALRGEITPNAAFDYYLGWIIDGSINPHYQGIPDADVPFAREWGLKVALEDLHQVVQRARRGGRTVVLGGHALGASQALSYSAWNFNGRPGFKNIDGLVAIDGGMLGTFDAFDLAQAQAAISELQTASPWLDLLGIPTLPWLAGAFAESLGLYAKLEPTAPSAVQQFPLLPPAFNPGFPVTNRGLLGFALDEDTSPERLKLIHLRAGALAAAGNPRDWVDGEITPIANAANLFAQEPHNGVDWYFPKRLTIDRNSANDLVRSPVTDFLGLRTWHLPKVDVPLYAIQTAYTDGRVLLGARRFIKRSRVTRQESVLVDRALSMSHFDPLTAAPRRNAFIKTVVPFLRELTEAAPNHEQDKD